MVNTELLILFHVVYVLLGEGHARDHDTLKNTPLALSKENIVVLHPDIGAMFS